MDKIVINNIEYNFSEKTYTINKNMSFKVKLVRFIKKDKIVVLSLLKSLIIKINNKEENYKEFDKKLKLKDYLRYTENIELINNISLDINNKVYYNFIADSDAGRPASESTNVLTEDNKRIDVQKLNETCTISPNKTITNFEYIPIFHRNGSEKKSETEVIVHFSILIDMLCKVYSEFKHLILKLSDIILNLAELNEQDLETYMNMSMSQCIQLLKEKDENITNLENLLDNREDHINYLNSELNDRDDYIEELEEDLYSSNEIYDETVNNYESTIERMDRRYEELLRRFDEAEFRANERFLKSEERSNLRTNRIISKIEGNTKPN